MARSSQDTSHPAQKRRAIYTDAKDQYLYDRDTRWTAGSTTLDQQRRQSATVRNDSPHLRNSRARYTDGGVLPRDNTSSVATATRGRNERVSNSTNRASTTSRSLQPRVSLSNLFEDSQRNDIQYSTSENKTSITHIGKGRNRSFSNTSLYDLERAPEILKNENNVGNDFDMAEDKIAAPHAVEEGKNARVLDLQNDTGNATISLTEFAKLEKIVPLKHIEVKEQNLVDLAEPLIQDVTVLYEKEWDQAIIAEERLYKETAMSLGALLDGDMMEAVFNIKAKLQDCIQVHHKVKEVITEESLAAKKSMLKLIENQKTLLLQYKEIQDRIHKRDENIISEIRAIHANSIDEQERITHEYIEKADNLDDKVGNMKNEKTLTNDFNRYLEKCINLNANKTREKATTAEKKKITRRATRA